jgi:putative oxidoreductase
MKLVSNIESWADAHHPKYLDFIRLLLGVVLIAKGISFLGNTDIIVRMLEDTRLEFLSISIAHYVIITHLVGGILIAIGLVTRVAIIFQLPILLGAIIFVNIRENLSILNSDLLLSLLIFVLLIFFFIYGSGPWSVDNYVKAHPDE